MSAIASPEIIIPPVGTGAIIYQRRVRGVLELAMAAVKTWADGTADGWHLEWDGQSAAIVRTPPMGQRGPGAPRSVLGRLDLFGMLADRPNEEAVLVRACVTDRDLRGGALNDLRMAFRRTLDPMLNAVERTGA